MALNPTVLTAELFLKLMQKHLPVYPLTAVGMAGFYQIIAEASAEAIIAHVTANAVVLPTALTWPGGMAPLPVVGTGTIS